MSTTTLPAPPRSRQAGAVGLLRFLRDPLGVLAGLRPGDHFRVGALRAELAEDEAPEGLGRVRLLGLQPLYVDGDAAPPVLDPALAGERAARRADAWVEGFPLDLLAELRALRRAAAWEALTGTDLDAAQDLGEALEAAPGAPAWLGYGPPLGDGAGTQAARRKVESVLALMGAQGRADRIALDQLHAPLAWALHLLAKHPEAEARLHADLEDGSTAYAAGVLAEAIRLYPPVWAVFRREHGGLRVHSAWAARGDAAFDPERTPAADPPADAVAMLAALGRRWAYRPAGPEPRPVARWAVEPRGGLRMKPVPRP